MQADSVALNPPATGKVVRIGFDPDRLAGARKKLDAMGLTYKQWAEKNGFEKHYDLVRQVLAGKKPCRSGISHNIAVKLGLKDGDLSDGQ